MTEKHVTLAHGSGGERMQHLITEVVCKYFDDPILARLDDAALLDNIRSDERLALSTDGFVVQPVEFPGGDIGKLAVCGTVNDLAMMGGRPIALSVALILEEGLEMVLLERILKSMRTAARQARIPIVCGDTKVVNRGNCDKIFITTSGIAAVARHYKIGAAQARAGDAVILSGTIAEHEVAVLNARESLGLMPAPRTDCAALNSLVSRMLAAGGESIHVLRDPTRGGVATVLNEISRASRVGIEIDERYVPLKAVTRAACELLGLDPLYLACEGRLVAFVAAGKAEQVLKAMHCHPLGTKAAIVGSVAAGHRQVILKTTAGSRRMLDMLVHEQMPRIC